MNEFDNQKKMIFFSKQYSIIGENEINIPT